MTWLFHVLFVGMIVEIFGLIIWLCVEQPTVSIITKGKLASFLGFLKKKRKEEGGENCSGLLASNQQLEDNCTFDRCVLRGSKAPDGAFPYKVSVIGPLIESYGSCGGSIIDSTTILTAAFCVDGFAASDFSVVIGTNNLNKRGTKHAVRSTKIHENYLRDTTKNLFASDIALLKLATAITFSPTITPIELETSNVSAGVAVIHSGWGVTSYPGLTPAEVQYIELKTISNFECQLNFEDCFIYIDNSHICTVTKKREGGRYGETGAPLVANGRQIGIASWESPCPGDVDVWTRVSFYANWIKVNSN